MTGQPPGFIPRGRVQTAHGIHTVPELCAASKPVLHRVWGGVLGDRLWHLLRGDEIPDLVSARKTIGHSHVLPPHCRHPDKAWPILCKLLHSRDTAPMRISFTHIPDLQLEQD